MVLGPAQLRVLGALIEKEIATPEAYPLSLNALLAACNQRSSRDPVMELDEAEARQALHQLQEMGWAAAVQDARVPKYEHRIRTVLNLRRDEVAVLCLLLLRGPQTPGELRARADRLYSFDGLDAVEATLVRLAAEPDSATDQTGVPLRPLVKVLQRQPGSREARYAHLLGGAVDALPHLTPTSARDTTQNSSGRGVSASANERISELEAQVAALRAAVLAIEASLALESSIAPGIPSAENSGHK